MAGRYGGGQASRVGENPTVTLAIIDNLGKDTRAGSRGGAIAMSHPVPPGAGVLGRDAELRQIDAWLESHAADVVADVPGGAASVLVIEGEPGIGKSTLWAEAIRRATVTGRRVLPCRPVSSDAGLSYVGLCDLLRAVTDADLAELAPPQRRALRVALLRDDAGQGECDPRAVGIGLTTLLGAIAAGQPLILAVDDAQWLDPASARALAFALRRLGGSAVTALIARRTPDPAGQRDPFRAGESWLDDQGLQRLRTGPLTVAAIHQMFSRALGASFSRPLLVRIHGAAAGNPFYALEIGRELRRAGSPQPGQPLPVPADHRELALLRMRRLPRATRAVLAVLAARPGTAAADLDLDALAAAERAGIAVVRPDGRVEFTHPLFGSALYSSLPEAERRRLHRSLAAQASIHEERARHLALAADGPDAAAAAELDQAADAARARGAGDTAVELKDLAGRLTPPGDQLARLRRSIELANLRYFAGDPTGAREELVQWLDVLEASDERAEVLLELGTMRWIQGEADAGRALMSQAIGEARTPALLARIHARLASGADDADLTVRHAQAALALLDQHADPQLYSYVLHMFALFKLYSGRGADHASIEQGMALQRAAAGWEISPIAAFWARNFDDFATARQRFEELIRVFRAQGDEAQVCAALAHLASVEAMTGQMDRARALAAEALDLAGQTEQETYREIALSAHGQVCAQAGEVAQARAAATELLGLQQRHPDLLLEGMARIVLGQAALTTGDLAEADRELSRAAEIERLVHNREPANQRFHADHAEAVIGLGDTARAELLVASLEARAADLPRPWILAVSARCRGLLNAAAGDLDAALADYQRALAAHQDLDMPAELGRTLLAAGRLHRRRNERQQAQECLARAVEAFAAGGALGWAVVAADELSRARGRRGDPGELTPTERAICELAASGLRNHEIAARLYLSAKTVEANLSRGYRKLGVRSRTELATAIRTAG
jgi:DNA-binding CsgD family transcriptional regulator